ncbi:putative DNA-binding response regulator, LuxR family [uncultured Desulfobacterium sp.]|uniref:Putative DNA-binding response regulator, LuxR family n=1 Tax=uncultured Desulfobacterium sp. TaxID=201089 RepID=A0A445MSR8_9BACT|nr:putative DNA-binding response regulator, LuxR family [uncultured Desulfobacterium sp.]
MEPTLESSAKNILPEVNIHIVGRNMLQNQLLLSFLKNEIGADGTYVPTVREASLTGGAENMPTNFLVIDTKDVEIDKLWYEIALWKKEVSGNCYLALFNVEPKLKIEKKAMSMGICGIFYNNTSLHTIAKGVSAVLKGELWYSRESLKRCLLEIRPLLNYNEPHLNTYLTLREVEILTLIASGYGNKAIADHLNISEHTVKTHIYNIYKKLRVSNRLQASLWAAKNLS